MVGGLDVAGLIKTVLAVVRRRRSRQLEAAEAADQRAAVRRTAHEDVITFGEELRRIGQEVGPALDAGGRADYQSALDTLRAARESIATVGEPRDVERITDTLEDGRRALARVRARLERRPLPEQSPPCFFDPQHGPSTAEVAWTPPGGKVRRVPACARDAERAAHGYEPESRRVRIGDRRVPYWEAGAAFGPWAAGYFGGYDVLPALLAGTTLGGAMFGREYGYPAGRRRRGRWWLTRGRSDRPSGLR